jgi:hypothetical protein
MHINTFTSREFNQNPNKAKNAAKDGIVFITERGAVSHVLLKLDDYNKISAKQPSIIDMLAMPDECNLEFEARNLNSKIFKRDVF